QADVIALAHILTGWGLPKGGGGGGGGNRRPGAAGMQGAEMGGFFPFMRRGQSFRGPGAAPVDPSGFYFDAQRHDFSSKNFLGHEIEGGGIAEVEHSRVLLAT